NVWMTGYQARRSQLHQWRRDTERPVLARIISISDKSLEALREVAYERSQWIESVPGSQAESIEARDKARTLWDMNADEFEELRYQIAQLDLVAGEQLRKTAHALLSKHESLRHWLRPASGADSPIDLFDQSSAEVIELRDRLIDVGR